MAAPAFGDRRAVRARRTMMAVAAAAAATTVACTYSPTFPEGKIRCRADTDCPSSQSCHSGTCSSPGWDGGTGAGSGGATGGKGAPDAATGGDSGGAGGVNTGGISGSPGTGGSSSGGTGGPATGGHPNTGGGSGGGGSTASGGRGTGGASNAASGGAGSGGTMAATGGAGPPVPVCGNGKIETGELCDGNCPASCPVSGCMRRHLTGSGCNVSCVDDPAETRCQSSDGCCPGAARGCNATNDAECAAMCGNGTKEAGETCDPVADCMTAFTACVSDANNVRTRIGDVATCTFRCDAVARTCVGGDGLCPSTCSRANDADCPGEPGAACTAASECRIPYCANATCCDRACTGACEACNRPGSVGTCSLPSYTTDPDNCGGCGAVCSNNHVAQRTCAASTCTSTCATGYRDCNSDLKTDGCETETQSNPAHCGACTTVCKYGVCQAGACAFTKSGFSAAGASSANRFTGTMYCHRVHVSAAGKLAALGVNVGTNASAVAFRLALYSDSAGAPLNLLAQTAELTSVSGAAVEGTVSGTVGAVDTWLCLLTAATLRVTTEASATAPVYSDPYVYGPFPTTAPVLTRATPDPVGTNVYVVTTP